MSTGTRLYHLQAARLPQGWVRGVQVSVADNGFITAIDTAAEGDAAAGGAGGAGGTAAAAAAERIAGIVIPGMPNGHSHAFQRAMAGSTEFRRTARDSFWTWRQAMYALANRIEPDDLELLATQLFIEMLKAGYTSVAEFHYLHRQLGGASYGDRNALWDAVAAAAAVSGIALTFLPTLYQTSDFGAQPLKREQARFALDTDRFVRAVADRIDAERHAATPVAPPTAPATPGAAPATLRTAPAPLHTDHDALRTDHDALPTARATLRTGAAFHSLRAVPLATLREAAQALRALDRTLPLHIHVAEQVKEVRACQAHTGRRPIELLLDSALLDEHWCLVHATHATAAELQGIAASRAAVCLSISTEANLGDGFFDAARFLKLEGRLCVGSDSQATVSPAEELRWMEYQQRLRKRRRGVLADQSEAHAGTYLWSHAAKIGAQALGQPAGALAVGQRADWLVLDDQHASLAGASLETTLDGLVFAGGAAAIRDVMVAGRWVIKDGRHAAEQPLQARFAALMTRLGA
jgi:formimidoylglutamate deiminase